MTLLREVTENPLDPGYEAAAARRSTHPDYRPSWASRAVVVVLAVVLGMGLAVSIDTLRGPVAGRNEARDLLVAQIVERRERNAELTETNNEMSAEILELTNAQLALTDPSRREELEHLAVASGATALQGPGVVVTLTDSDQAQANPAGFDAERVQAVDIQVVVNGLWAAGAEAVAVGGTRVGPGASIRGAGQSLLVDLAPVSSPYEIVAIGPPDQLRTALRAGTVGAHMDLLRTRYNIGVDGATAQQAEVPAAVTRQPRFAQAGQPGQTRAAGTATGSSGSSATGSEADQSGTAAGPGEEDES